MGFLKRLLFSWSLLLAIVAGAVNVVPGFAAATPNEQNATVFSDSSTNKRGQATPPVQQAQAKTKSPAPTPAVERGPSNVDLVNKALKPGASDPDVPLPHPDLTAPAGNPPGQMTGPQIFGRQEQGGGVLGLRVPIPADRSTTTYSCGRSGQDPEPTVR